MKEIGRRLILLLIFLILNVGAQGPERVTVYNTTLKSNSDHMKLVCIELNLLRNKVS